MPAGIPLRKFTAWCSNGYYESVIAKGAELVKKLRDEPWDMREFGIRTVDGHRIAIGRELERMKQE